MRPKRLAVLPALPPFLLALALLAAGSGLLPASAPDPARPAYLPGELLVKYREGAGDREVDRARGRVLGRRIGLFRHAGIEHVRIPAGKTVEEAAAEVAADPAVVYAGPNYLATLESPL